MSQALRRITLTVALLLIGVHPAEAVDFATRTMQATYKLFNKDSTAAGFFVQLPATPEQNKAPLAFVSAKHVFQKMSGDTALIVLRKRRDDGSYERRDLPLTIKKDGRPLWTDHPTEDVAAIAVTLPEDAEVTPLGWEHLASEQQLIQRGLHLASGVFMLGYPTRVEANKAGFPIARHATIAGHPLTPIAANRTFLLDVATFSGDSGGPVFVPSDARSPESEQSAPLVIGMVLAQLRFDENTITLNEERKTHYPLSLAVVLHAHYVRETAELLRKPPAEAPPSR